MKPPKIFSGQVIDFQIIDCAGFLRGGSRKSKSDSLRFIAVKYYIRTEKLVSHQYRLYHFKEASRKFLKVFKKNLSTLRLLSKKMSTLGNNFLHNWMGGWYYLSLIYPTPLLVPLIIFQNIAERLGTL